MQRELLENMVAIPSVYPREKDHSLYLSEYLTSHGFGVENQDVEGDRSNIFATRGSGDKSILFYGHLDTVPLTSQSDWQTDPFHLTQKDGNLYGLGAYDMKGGIASFIEACEHSNSYTKILLGVDEENWSAGAWKAVQERQSFFNDVELIISAEPNFGLGLNGITNRRTGRYLYDVLLEGVPAHIAKYQEGVDAINLLGNFIHKFYDQRNELFHNHGSYAQVRRVQAESVGMSVCGVASAIVEVFSTQAETLLDVQSKIQSLTQGTVSPKERPTPYLSGYNFRTFPYQSLIGEIVKNNTGSELELKSRMSVADDNVLATLGIPVITWGPDGGNAHAPNEYVKADSLNTLTQMFSQLLASRNII
jgi:succinyl-diaminopimelate desuccinylase